MKKLILFLLVISPEFAKAACAKKIDPSKVMLFIDTNNSEIEIETTEKAACARGEKLLIVPKNYKDFAKYTAPVDVANKKVAKLKCYEKSVPGCKEAQDELAKAFTELSKFKTAQKSTSEGVNEALEQIKASNAKLVNLSISGHDGGGSFSGAKGMYSRQELANAMKDMGDINEVKSLMLLGCYTGTPKEVLEWKSIFPQTKLIGGYDGSAPLADRPQGHQYISDILLKEKQLTTQADQKKLQAYVDANIKGLGNLNAALFLQCSDGTTTHDYYYGSKKSKKIEKFDMKECLEKKKELQELSLEVNRYISGEIEPPADTQNGALRAIYNRARSLEHCSELTDVPVDVNAVFNLLFYGGVKSSFAHFYKDELIEAGEIIDGISPEEMEKNFRKNQAETEKTFAEFDADLLLMETNPAEYLAKHEKEMDSLKSSFEEMLKDPKNASFREFFTASMNGINNGGAISGIGNEDDMKRFNTLSDLQMKYFIKKSEVENVKGSPTHVLAMKKTQSQMQKETLKNQELAFLELKEGQKDPKNKIWIPNAANLKKYDRKELMENTHRMNKLMSAGVLSEKQHAAMNWLNLTKAKHLQAFDNPFPWHEYNNHSVEAPLFPYKLKDFLSGKMKGGGFGMMMGPGGSTGGGYVGGMGGGMMSGPTSLPTTPQPGL